MLADLAPSEAINHLSASVELIQRHPHLGPEITTLPQWILLELFKSGLTMEIIGDPFGDIDEYFIGPLDLHVFLKCILIIGVAIRMVLDG